MRIIMIIIISDARLQSCFKSHGQLLGKSMWQRQHAFSVPFALTTHHTSSTTGASSCLTSGRLPHDLAGNLHAVQPGGVAKPCKHGTTATLMLQFIRRSIHQQPTQ